jgi:hypothetical protein
MPISFACAASHSPGITAWADAAPPAQKERVYGAFDQLRARLDASGAETLILLTSEHWANFFLDHMGAFCVGRAETYSGPIEPWLKIDKRLGGRKGEVVAYEAVTPWATGVGLMTFPAAA